MTMEFIMLMLAVTSPFLLIFTAFMPMENKEDTSFGSFEIKKGRY